MLSLNADWVAHAELQERGLPQGRNAHHPSGSGISQRASNENIQDGSSLKQMIRKGLVENQHDLEVLRKDPSSPLYSVSSFEDLKLKPELLRGVYAMGFNSPSKIQEVALPALMANPPMNMIAQSQSGTGKTAAFVLAILARVDPDLDYPQVLILSPTYELAIQTGEVACKMGQFCKGIGFRYAISGEKLPRGSRITEHIVIGTPGKVQDWAMRYRYFDLSKIKVFVLDEADVMVSLQGHQDQTYRIHKRLHSDCQMILFSATYEEKVMEFAENIVPNSMIIRLKREEESLQNIKQYFVMCANDTEKYKAITNIYGAVTIGQAIIFCHTRKTATWLQTQMSNDGHAVAVLSADFAVDERLHVLDRFRDGKEKVLITTNVLARGIDIQQVTVVVNYDLPLTLHKGPNYDVYLHRIGRTGRFGSPGFAFNLIESENALKNLKDIEHHFGKAIKLLNTSNIDDMDKLNNDIDNY